MKQGERFAFSWTAKGGAVDMDMHGEPAGSSGDDATSYWKEDALESGHGAFEAPVTGNHGWFWQNLGAEQTLTIKLTATTKFEKDKKPVERTLLLKGDRVGVATTKSKSGELTAARVVLGLPAPKPATPAKPAK